MRTKNAMIVALAGISMLMPRVLNGATMRC